MLDLPEELPHLWQKPVYDDLVNCLKRLQVRPPVWGFNVSRADALKEQSAGLQDRREVNLFLSSIISSNLAWIEDEDQREELWTAASRRLAERCGRTAMGEITRAFPFVTEGQSPFDLIIREPPITGDALGLKTWGSSYVLARLLPRFATHLLSHILNPEEGAAPRVLELGSGTGLLGLAAACFWRVPVTLTDLPTIIPNLVHNVEANRPMVEAMGGSVEAAALTWGNRSETDTRFLESHQYKLVIAADPLYDDDHPILLSGAVHEQLSLSPSARVLVTVPLRDEITHKLLSEFRKEMLGQSQALVCINESTELGQDDWGEDDEHQQVACWWGVFKRQVPELEETT